MNTESNLNIFYLLISYTNIISNNLFNPLLEAKLARGNTRRKQQKSSTSTIHQQNKKRAKENTPGKYTSKIQSVLHKC